MITSEIVKSFEIILTETFSVLVAISFTLVLFLRMMWHYMCSMNYQYKSKYKS